MTFEETSRNLQPDNTKEQKDQFQIKTTTSIHLIPSMVELRSNGRHSSKCRINKQRASHQSQVYQFKEMEHHHQWIVKDEPSKKMQAGREETPRRT